LNLSPFRAIVTIYDNVGRVRTVTSYADVTLPAATVNQVEYLFDGWGNLAAEYRAHRALCDFRRRRIGSSENRSGDGGGSARNGRAWGCR
jgi:hypothetical protein